MIATRMMVTSVPARGIWLIIAAAAAAVSAPASSEDAYVTDARVADAVEDQLYGELTVPAYEIDVSVSEGVVTLNGEVPHLLAKERASRVAQAVKGVRSVINKLNVDSVWAVDDDALQQDVEAALLDDPATESYEIDVSANDSVVTLQGTVESWQEKQLATTVAKSVRGVANVRDRIEVDYETDRPDAEIRREIERALHWNALIDDALINVMVDDGRVTLSGTVGSARERSLAVAEAYVAGVRSVDDEALDVARWARDPDMRGDKLAPKSDADISAAVERAMLYDPRVNRFDVEVEVEDGVVTLRGTVDNLKAKRAAANDVKNTVGVVAVENRLKVRPDEPINDAAIAGRIIDALFRDPYVERYELEVSVVNGVAYLHGTVNTYFERAQAEQIAAGVRGVTDVVNSLNVEADHIAWVFDPYVYEGETFTDEWYDFDTDIHALSDEQLRREVADEFFWSPFVNGDEVSVAVDDGVVTLTGTVDSYNERRLAEKNAFDAGAVAVNNELIVTY